MKVYKIGGGIIDDKVELSQFLNDFSKINSPKILVHGGGKGASEQLKKMGIEPKMIQGRRVTDSQTLEVVVGFYAGITNKQIIASLQALGENSIGISGADGNAIRGSKRPVKEIDYGFVGDVSNSSVNVEFFDLLIQNQLTPVVCAITYDENGQLLNTNADTIASTIAVAMSKLYEVELIFCFDKLGVMKDLADENSLIPEINFELYQELKADEIIADGMIPKLDNAFEVINSGVKIVRLQHAKNVNSEIGTVIK